MAKYGSDDAFLLIDGYDISGDTFEMTHEVRAEEEETHGFGDSWVEHEFTGIKRSVLSHKTFYNDAAGASDAALINGVGTNRILLAGMGGTRGLLSMEGAYQRNYVREVERGRFHKVSAEYMGTFEADQNLILLQPLATQVAGGVSAQGVTDNGAASTNGGVAVLQVTNLVLGGYTSLSIHVQSSSDNGGGDPYAQIGSIFANITTAPNAQRIEIAPATTVERYLRVFLTWNGAGAGQSVQYAVAFERR